MLNSILHAFVLDKSMVLMKWGVLAQTGAGCWCLHPRGLALIYRVSHSVSVSQTTALLSSTGSLLFCRAVIKGLFVLPAVFFISRNLISSPLNIA